MSEIPSLIVINICDALQQKVAYFKALATSYWFGMDTIQS